MARRVDHSSSAPRWDRRFRLVALTIGAAPSASVVQVFQKAQSPQAEPAETFPIDDRRGKGKLFDNLSSLMKRIRFGRKKEQGPVRIVILETDVRVFARGMNQPGPEAQ